MYDSNKQDPLNGGKINIRKEQITSLFFKKFTKLQGILLTILRKIHK